jgi:hypothetical protein
MQSPPNVTTEGESGFVHISRSNPTHRFVRDSCVCVCVREKRCNEKREREREGERSECVGAA